MVKLHVKVIGHVQGVFYRQSTKEMAERLTLSGGLEIAWMDQLKLFFTVLLLILI